MPISCSLSPHASNYRLFKLLLLALSLSFDYPEPADFFLLQTSFPLQGAALLLSFLLWLIFLLREHGIYTIEFRIIFSLSIPSQNFLAGLSSLLVTCGQQLQNSSFNLTTSPKIRVTSMTTYWTFPLRWPGHLLKFNMFDIKLSVFLLILLLHLEAPHFY